MRIAATCAYAILILSVSAGCSQNPAAPTPSSGTPPSTSQNINDALSIAAFGLDGWHDDRFHYVATLTVSVPVTGATVYVQRVDFTSGSSGADTRLGSIVFGGPQRVVAAGGTLDLFQHGPPVELPSAAALASITVAVSFTNDAGQAGTAVVTRVAPPLATNVSSAALVIERFSVDVAPDDGAFSYRPQLTLRETAGVSRALIKKMTFELLDVGPPGRVPVVWDSHVVPAGGSITFDQDDPYGPWLEIGSTADASRVSLEISFVDDAGRGGVVTAIATVAR